MSTTNIPTHPIDKQHVHKPEIPSTKAWCVKGGQPVHTKNRDIRFPLIWKVDTHPFNHSKYIKHTWVIIIDTDEKARAERARFEATLEAPLGPDAYMTHYGMLYM